MLELKLPRNMEYLGREKREDKYETRQKPLGVVMDKRTGEQYVILNRLGTMISYNKYYK